MNQTAIPYCDFTWNWLTGCTKGCPYCFARLLAEGELAGRCGYPAPPNAFQPTFHPKRLDEPLKVKKPSVILTCSMGDMFGPEVQPEWIDAALEVMETCSWHIFLALTKRPDLIEKKIYGFAEECPFRELGGGDYLPNLWLGISAENQAAFDERWPYLEAIKGFHKFVSLEPLHGPVDLGPARPEWVIVGGQTGPGAELMPLEAARSIIPLRRRCKELGIPYFWKQFGSAEIPCASFFADNDFYKLLSPYREYPPEIKETRRGK